MIIVKTSKHTYNFLQITVLTTGSIAFHFLIAFVLIIVLIYGAFIALDIYTDHGREYEVPDFTGMTIAEVDSLADVLNLNYEVFDSIFIETITKGIVVDQKPPDGFKVKEKRIIYVTVNAFSPEKIKMPDLRKISLKQAQADLEAYGLNIGKLEYIPDLAINYVFQQKYNGKVIHEGTPVPKGAYIDFVLGEGLSDEKTSTPYLIGLSLKEAQIKATSAFLNIGMQVYDNSVENMMDSTKAVIWKQYPVFNRDSTLAMGVYIDVWLTQNLSKVEIGKIQMENDTIPEIIDDELFYDTIN
jgi:beta-lactam-binding protein with PASTA domain